MENQENKNSKHNTHNDKCSKNCSHKHQDLGDKKINQDASSINEAKNVENLKNLIESSEEYKLIKDSLLRAVAENENLRKRFEKEKEDLLKYAVNKFASDMLSVADNLQRAIDNIPNDEQNKTIRDGIVLTYNQVITTFKKHSIEKIETKVNDMFDSSKHQAMMEEESKDNPKGSIVRIMQDGYTIHGRLLRPVMVTVAK